MKEEKQLAESDGDAGSHSEQENNQTNQPVRHFPWGGLAFLLLIITLGAASAGGYYLWQQWLVFNQQQAQSFDHLQSKLEIKIEETELKPLQRDVESLRQKIQSLQGQLQQNEQERVALKGATEKLFELYGRDKNGWQLAEVEYLLRIAQHRLVIENDFSGAAKTLLAADGKLAEIADPGFLKVRVTIAEEVATLQSRKRPDLTGKVLTINSLLRQIPNLRIEPQGIKDARTASKDYKYKGSAFDFSVPGSWDDLRQDVSGFVNGLVTIKRTDIDSQIAKVNSQTVLQELSENLQLAKWSVLERDETQFKNLIMKSVEMFQQYFDQDSAQLNDFFEQLQSLSKQSIKPALPDISTSLLQLRKIMVYQATVEKQTEEELVEEADND